MPICPRCESDTVSTVAKSPVSGAWEVYLCSVCLFTWRSIEPESITQVEKYNKAFKVNPRDIPNAVKVPAIPERLTTNQ